MSENFGSPHHWMRGQQTEDRADGIGYDPMPPATRNGCAYQDDGGEHQYDSGATMRIIGIVFCSWVNKTGINEDGQQPEYRTDAAGCEPVPPKIRQNNANYPGDAEKQEGRDEPVNAMGFVVCWRHDCCSTIPRFPDC